MEAPRTPAQWFAVVAGVVLIPFGVLALVLGSTNFGPVGITGGEQFLLWRVSGWETILYMASGALGLVAASRVDGARMYALLAGLVYAAIAVWGFIDGNSVINLLAVDTTDNISHAVIGGLGMLMASLPEPAQRRVGIGHDSGRPSGRQPRAT